MFSTQSGRSERPKPGIHGMITSNERASWSTNGISASSPSSPGISTSGRPLPRRSTSIFIPNRVTNDAVVFAGLAADLAGVAFAATLLATLRMALAIFFVAEDFAGLRFAGFDFVRAMMNLVVA